MKTKAFAYLRVSSLGQSEIHGGTGIERQLDVCRRYAKSHGIEIVEVFKDEAVSGTLEAAHRPGLSRLMEVAKEQGIGLVLAERSDRIARNMALSEIVLGQLRSQNIGVIAAESGTVLTDDSSPERVLVRQLLGAVSHFDRAQLVAKMAVGRDKRSAALGRRCEGRRRISSHPEYQPVVERIRQLRRKPKGGERLSYAAIAGRLNSDGVAPYAGKQWHPSTVYRLVQEARTA